MSPKTRGFPCIYREPGGSLGPILPGRFGSLAVQFDELRMGRSPAALPPPMNGPTVRRRSSSERSQEDPLALHHYLERRLRETAPVPNLRAHLSVVGDSSE